MYPYPIFIDLENTQTLAHSFLPDAFQKQEKKNIRELYLPNADTWVAEFDSHVVGYIALIGNEIGGLFVQPTHHGRNWANSWSIRLKSFTGKSK